MRNGISLNMAAVSNDAKSPSHSASVRDTHRKAFKSSGFRASNGQLGSYLRSPEWGEQRQHLHSEQALMSPLSFGHKLLIPCRHTKTCFTSHRKGTGMAAKQRDRTPDILFEGVVIPKGTRSAKLAARGITNTDEMGDFLTAIFTDTLSGKIVLPPPESPNRMSSKMLKGLEQKLSRGLPMKIQASSIKRKRKSKPKQPKERIPKQN